MHDLARASAMALLLVGCGGDGERTIPMFEDGILLVGNCDAEVLGEDEVQIEQLYRGLNPAGMMLENRNTSGEYEVFTEQQPYLDFMASVNFGSVPITDWTRNQVAVVWYDAPSSCDVVLESYSVKTLDDGLMLDVKLFDASLNCNDTCTDRYQMLLVIAFPNDTPGSVCRRVEPGCQPT